MATLYWNQDTNLVTSQPFDQSAAAVECTRGPLALSVIGTRGDVNTGTLVLLDASYTLGFAARDPDLLKLGYGAGPTVLTRGATPADGYIGSSSTDTTFVRESMNVDDNSQPESPEYDVEAVLYYLPDDGSPATESLPFALSILPNYYRPGTPPADVVAVWSSPAQLQAAIAAAAAAQAKLPTPSANGQILTGNTDNSVAFVSLASLLSGNVTVGGSLTAASFSGAGANLTSLNPAALSGAVPLTLGGTGATTAAAARTNLGAEGTANKGAANGYAPLGADSRVPTANLPTYLAGALNFLGTWDANANSPIITSGTAGTGQQVGSYYVVGTSGTTTVDGVDVWTAGDWIVFDGTKWDKLDGSANPVASVNGQTGAVTVTVSAAVNGLRKSSGLGSTDVAAVAGTDYLAPNGSGANLTQVAPYHATGTPTFTLVGVGSVSVQAVGTDESGQIAVSGASSGSNVAANSEFLDVAFATPFGEVLAVVIVQLNDGTLSTMANGSSAAIPAVKLIAESVTGNGFKVFMGNGTVPAGYTCRYAYFVLWH